MSIFHIVLQPHLVCKASGVKVIYSHNFTRPLPAGVCGQGRYLLNIYLGISETTVPDLFFFYHGKVYEGGTISLATLILGHCKSWLFHHYCDVLHPRNKWNLFSKECLHRHWKILWLWVRGVSQVYFQHFFPQKLRYRLDFKYFFLDKWRMSLCCIKNKQILFSSPTLFLTSKNFKIRVSVLQFFPKHSLKVIFFRKPLLVLCTFSHVCKAWSILQTTNWFQSFLICA